MARDAAFAEFVARHGQDLTGFAYLLTRDHARAEDVVQDALVKLLRRWRSDAPDQPLPYTRRIVVNEYLGWRRRRASTEVELLDLTDVPLPDPSTLTDEREFAWRLLGSLTPRARAVIVLRYYADLPDREIAELVGCAEATVRSVASRALATLRSAPQLTSAPEET